MTRRLLWLISLLLWTLPTLAHGGGEIMVGRAPAGPFKLTIWMNPPQPAAGETVHITVGVLDGVEETAVLDAQVQVEVITAAGQEILSTPATTEESVNKLFYETDFVITDTGLYKIRVTVDREGAGGSADFTADIQEGSSINWLLLGGIGLAVILVMALAQRRRGAGESAN